MSSEPQHLGLSGASGDCKPVAMLGASEPAVMMRGIIRWLHTESPCGAGAFEDLRMFPDFASSCSD